MTITKQRRLGSSVEASQLPSSTAVLNLVIPHGNHHEHISGRPAGCAVLKISSVLQKQPQGLTLRTEYASVDLPSLQRLGACKPQFITANHDSYGLQIKVFRSTERTPVPNTMGGNLTPTLRGKSPVCGLC